MTTITDGTGTGNVVKVSSDNELYTKSVIETEEHNSNEKGDAYNINTGVITLTSGNESGVLYIKNNDPLKELVIVAIAVGLGPSTGGSNSEIPVITVVRNPTTGTVVSDASNVNINSNRNYGSSQTLTAVAYKGGEGKTLTDGEDHIIFFQAANGRLFAPIDEILPNGSSLGVKIAPQSSNTNMDCYVAVICYAYED